MADATRAAASALPEGTLSVPAAVVEEEEDEEVTVNIKTLGGPDFELKVSRDERVSELKAKVRRHTDVDEARQRLIYRGKVLADAEPLSMYKVEDGHFVHMVARPEGVPPPTAATASTDAMSSLEPSQSAVAAGVAAARRAGGLGTHGDSWMMGAGAPAATPAPAADAGGTGAGVLGGHGREAVLSAAASREQGDFLSNLLSLPREGGGGGGIRARPLNHLGSAAAAGAQNARDSAVAHDFFGERQRRRAGRARAAGDDHSVMDLPQDAAGDGGGANLEHIRQGLLTLHTLLSGTGRSRMGRELPESSADTAAAVAAAPAAPADDWVAPTSSRRRSCSNSRSESNGTTDRRDADATPAAVAAPAVTPTGGTPAAVAAATGAISEPNAEPDDLQATVSPWGTQAVGPSVEPRSTSKQLSAQDDEERPGEDGEVGAAVASSRPGGGGTGGGGSCGNGPRVGGTGPSFPASFDDGSGRDGEDAGSEGADEDKEQGNDGQAWESPRLEASGACAPSHRRPFLEQQEAARSVHESDSDSSEGPPLLLSDSGDSDDEQDRRRQRGAVTGPGVSGGVLSGPPDATPSEGEDDGGAAEEEEDEGEECKADGSSSPSGRQRPERRRRRFFVGQWLDVKDTVNNWLEATVMDMTSSGSRLQVHYNGWPPRWDEWLSWDSPRIAPFRTRTQHLPQAQHVSPAPVSAVRNAPRTGPLVDDVRVLVPEVQRVLREIAPMVDELSACCSRHLEQDPSTSPTGGRAVSHVLPWTRRRVQLHRQSTSDQQTHNAGGGVAGGINGASSAGTGAAEQPSTADDPIGRFKAADLAADVAPLFDRLGRMLTDIAPHLARLPARGDGTAAPAAGTGVDAAEPGELWSSLSPVDSNGRTGGGGGGGGGGAGRGGSSSFPEETTSAFRQLVSTSSPAPTSSNINIHIHAIVPLRGPPSPPPPPPPPPPTASASAVATPTRAERPPLAGAGSRQNIDRPWNGSSDGGNTGSGGSASLAAAARFAALSRAAAATAAASARGGGGGGGSGDSGSETDRGSNASGRGTFVAAPFPVDVARESSPLALSTTGWSLSGTRGTPSSSSSSSGETAAGFAVAAASVSDPLDRAGTGQGHGHGNRRGGGWRGLLRAFGVGGNGGGSGRASGRRDGGSGGGSSGGGGSGGEGESSNQGVD